MQSLLLLVLLLTSGDVGGDGVGCLLRFNELSSPFFNSSFLEQDTNASPSSFLELKFTSDCTHKERVLTSKAVIVFATKLYKGSPKPFSLFFCSFHKLPTVRLRSGKRDDLYTIGSSEFKELDVGQQPLEDVLATYEKRSSSFNSLSETVHERFSTVNQRLYGKTLDYDSSIVFAIIDNKLPKRGTNKKVPAGFTAFLKSYSSVWTDGKTAIENELGMSFQSKDEAVNENIADQVQDVLVFPMRDETFFGRKQVRRFFSEKDRVPVALLPVLNDQRTIPKGLSISRNPKDDKWIYTVPTPGVENDVNDMHVDFQTFDLSDATARDDPTITTQSPKFDTLLTQVLELKDPAQPVGGDEEPQSDGGGGDNEEEEADANTGGTGDGQEEEREEEEREEEREEGEGEGEGEKEDGSSAGEKDEDKDDDDDEEPAADDAVAPGGRGDAALDGDEEGAAGGNDNFDDFDDFGNFDDVHNNDDEMMDTDDDGAAGGTNNNDNNDDVILDADDEMIDVPQVRRKLKRRYPMDESLPTGLTEELDYAIQRAVTKAFRDCIPQLTALMEESQTELLERAMREKLSCDLQQGETFEERVERIAMELYEEERRRYSLNDARTYAHLEKLKYQNPDIAIIQSLNYAQIIVRPDSTRALRCMLCESRIPEQFGHPYGKTIPRKEPGDGGVFISAVRRHFLSDTVKEHMAKHDARLADIRKRAAEFIKGFQPSGTADEPTEFLLRVVYTLNKLGVAHRSLPELLDLTDALQVNTGHLFRSGVQCAEITAVISRTFQNDLHTWMRTYSMPFSLMVDSSSSADGKHYFNVLIRVAFRQRPLNLFLTTILLEESETSEYLFRLLKQYFKNSGLIYEFRHQLVSASSDGANVMSAPDNGLRGRISRYIEKYRSHIPALEFIWIHCANHKFELMFAKAMTGKYAAVGDEEHVWNYRVYSTKVLNRIKSHFGPTSHARRHALLAVHDPLKPLIAIRGVYSVRWVSSQLEANVALLRNWKTLTKALWQSASSGKADHSTHVSSSLFHMMTSARWFGWILWEAGLLEIVSKYSKILQSSTATFTQLKDIKTDFFNDLDKLHHSPQELPIIKDFLTLEVRCRDVGTTYIRTGAVAACRDALFEGGYLAESQVIWLSRDSPHDEDIIFRAPESADGNHDANKHAKNKKSAELVRNARAYLEKMNDESADEDLFSTADDSVRLQRQATRQELRTFLAFDDAKIGYMTKARRGQIVASLKRSYAAHMEYQGSMAWNMQTISPEFLRNIATSGFHLPENQDARKKFYVYMGLNEQKTEEAFRKWGPKFDKLQPDEKAELKALEREPGDWFSRACAFLTCGNTLNDVFSSVVVVSPSNAEAERSFSHLFWLRDKRSSSLGIVNLDHRMRIAYNGPGVYEWNPKAAVKEWRRTHWAADDPRRVRGPDVAPRNVPVVHAGQRKTAKPRDPGEAREHVLAEFMIAINA